MSWMFVSKHRNFQTWLEVPRESYTADGKIRVEKAGLVVEFRGGYYETDDEKIAKALMKSRDYGIAFKLYKGEPIEEGQFKKSALELLTDTVKRPPQESEGKKEEKPKRTFRCKECGAEFNSVYALAKHKREAHVPQNEESGASVAEVS